MEWKARELEWDDIKMILRFPQLRGGIADPLLHLQFQAEYEGDLTDRKAEVKQMVIDAITAANEEDSDEEEEEER